MLRSLDVLTLTIGFFLYVAEVKAQCPPEPANGELVFKSQEEVEAFAAEYPNCKDLDYDLYISLSRDDVGTPIHDLSPLSGLIKIKGQLKIGSSQGGEVEEPRLLDLHGLHNLESLDRLLVSGSKDLRTLSALSEINELISIIIIQCEKLEDLGMGSIHISDYVSFQGNPELRSIGSVQTNAHNRVVVITNNPQLDLANSFQDLRSVYSLNLNHHDISFVENIRSIAHLNLNGNGAVQDLSDFKNLTNLSSGLILNQLQDLENLELLKDAVSDTISNLRLEQLPKLSDISAMSYQNEYGWLKLNSCPLLNDISAFEEVRVVGELGVFYMDGLEDLSGFKNLERAGIEIDIRGNENLSRFSGFKKLTEVGREFYIRENPLLRNLDEFSNLSTIGSDSKSGHFSISENNQLNSILGLRNVYGGYESMSIYQNPELPICHIQSVCETIFHNPDARINIYNNLEGCDSELEVGDQCFEPVVQKIFFDQNDSGIDENEYAVPIGYSEYNQEHTIYPDNSGHIKFIPFDGEINLNYIPPATWTPTTDTEYVFPDSDNLDTIKTGVYPKIEFDFLDVHLMHTPVVCDRLYDLKVVLKNNGTTILSVNTELNGVGHFISSIPLPTNIDTPFVHHEMLTLLPGQVAEIDFIFQSPKVDELVLGSTVFQNLAVAVYSEDGGLLFNEVQAYPLEFLCAYDPNDKQVFPTGVGEENYTLFDEEELQYLIRFQNTGNYHAEDIVIRDTLSQNLDWTTFQFIGASHDISEIRMDRNALSFVFENIFLPDSVNNEPESHGYVSYSIQPKSGLDENTRIENTAHIYFDSNPAIVTNTTLNTMVSELPGGTSVLDATENSFLIYPNPTTGKVWIQFSEDKPSGFWSLMNIKGERIKRGLIESKLEVDLKGLSSGIYFFNAKESVQKLVVE